MRHVIEEHGHEVIEAEDGREGYEKARIHNPGFIITDDVMPKVDGFLFLRNIKKDPHLSAVPCVIYPAGSKGREFALFLGAEAFIARPGTPEELWNEIKKILERKSNGWPDTKDRPVAEEKEFIRRYSNVVAAQLEEKIRELEKNISHHEQIEKRLIESEISLANAQRIAHLGNWEWDIVNNRLCWSDEIYRIFGLVPQSFGATYEAFLNSVHPDDREFVKESVNKALCGKHPYSIDHRIILPDGTVRVVHEQAEVIFDNTDKAIQMNGTVQDITERKKAEEELRKLSTVIDQSINTIFITNVEGVIEYVNPMFEQVTGYSKEEVIGQNPRVLASGETSNAEYEELWKTITAGKTWRGVFKNKKKDGQYYWGSGVISPIRNEKGLITHFLAVQEDITEKMKSEERIRYLASYDGPTGLFNRTCFMGLLDKWMSHARDNNQTGVILLINIDGFRLINDVYGHNVGDNLLHRVSVLLRNILADIDPSYGEKTTGESIIGRMGGDEFSILLPSRDEKEGVDIAEHIRKRLGEFQFADITSKLTASIGVVLYPKHGATIHDLFTKADAAVYHAKELGQNKVHLYHPDDLVLEKMHSKIKWKGCIQKALEEDRFELWFQPILDLRDNHIHHYEVLARMRDPDGKIILPELFISMAERFGLISAIDCTIIEKAMGLLSMLNQMGKTLSLSINLSGKELGDIKLLEFLKLKLTETGVNPKQLIFEITETAAIQDIDKAVKFVETLKSIGCGFSLDDFGVGFTSFQHLKVIRVDSVKIDGSFIRKLDASKVDRLFVKAIVDVAKGMEIKTIAEFVETEETMHILKEYGVDYVQGYLIGKPSPSI